MSEVKKKIKRDLYSLNSKCLEQAKEIRDLKLKLRLVRQGLKLAMADESERTGKIKTAYDRFYK